jgi:hypothetical protein
MHVHRTFADTQGIVYYDGSIEHDSGAGVDVHPIELDMDYITITTVREVDASELRSGCDQRTGASLSSGGVGETDDMGHPLTGVVVSVEIEVSGHGIAQGIKDAVLVISGGGVLNEKLASGGVTAALFRQSLQLNLGLNDAYTPPSNVFAVSVEGCVSIRSSLTASSSYIDFTLMVALPDDDNAAPSASTPGSTAMVSQLVYKKHVYTFDDKPGERTSGGNAKSFVTMPELYAQAVAHLLRLPDNKYIQVVRATHELGVHTFLYRPSLNSAPQEARVDGVAIKYSIGLSEEAGMVTMASSYARILQRPDMSVAVAEELAYEGGKAPSLSVTRPAALPSTVSSSAGVHFAVMPPQLGLWVTNVAIVGVDDDEGAALRMRRSNSSRTSVGGAVVEESGGGSGIGTSTGISSVDDDPSSPRVRDSGPSENTAIGVAILSFVFLVCVFICFNDTDGSASKETSRVYKEEQAKRKRRDKEARRAKRQQQGGGGSRGKAHGKRGDKDADSERGELIVRRKGGDETNRKGRKRKEKDRGKGEKVKLTKKGEWTAVPSPGQASTSSKDTAPTRTRTRTRTHKHDHTADEAGAAPETVLKMDEMEAMLAATAQGPLVDVGLSTEAVALTETTEDKLATTASPIAAGHLAPPPASGAADAAGQLAQMQAGGGGAPLLPTQAQSPSQARETLTECNVSIGSKVCRGPDWKNGDQDGGEGGLGIVLAFKKQDGASGRHPSLAEKSMLKLPLQCAVVQWRVSNKRCFYPIGKSNQFQLTLAAAEVHAQMPLATSTAATAPLAHPDTTVAAVAATATAGVATTTAVGATATATPVAVTELDALQRRLTTFQTQRKATALFGGGAQGKGGGQGKGVEMRSLEQRKDMQRKISMAVLQGKGKGQAAIVPNQTQLPPADEQTGGVTTQSQRGQEQLNRKQSQFSQWGVDAGGRKPSQFVGGLSADKMQLAAAMQRKISMAVTQKGKGKGQQGHGKGKDSASGGQQQANFAAAALRKISIAVADGKGASPADKTKAMAALRKISMAMGKGKGKGAEGILTMSMRPQAARANGKAKGKGGEGGITGAVVGHKASDLV